MRKIDIQIDEFMNYCQSKNLAINKHIENILYLAIIQKYHMTT